MTKSSPVLLCILDGLGMNPNPEGNAVALAKKPNLDKLFNEYPWTTLITNGTRVGLPDDQMGNSEVGHLNIGAGRVVEQWLYRISRDLRSKIKTITVPSPEKRVHLIGLFSHGGVHSDSAHLKIICEELLKNGSKDIHLHLILDGRDTAPNVAISDIKELLPFIGANPAIKIASLSGRFYAMDRDKRWDRTEAAFQSIALGRNKAKDLDKNEKAHHSLASQNSLHLDPLQYIESSHKSGVTDEFIEPISLTSEAIGDDDLIFFYNFRADRMRQIVSAFTADSFSGFNRQRGAFKKENILCMTQYDETFKLPFLFEALPIKNHLGETVSKAGLSQLRTAETEKYPHVTYFMNGLIEEPCPGEKREMVPSPRDVKTYDLKPEMNAAGVEGIVLKALESEEFDLIVVNFANCDMVGHTGVLKAAIEAVEVVDTSLERILSALKAKNGKALIIADHGNAEQMIDYASGSPHTAHTTYPVPAILFGYHKDTALKPNSALCDVAPTILKMLGVKQPSEMTGSSLFS
jgi:2,3-bisphosphoglycerate-independent phosphoglycerate mutase